MDYNNALNIYKHEKMPNVEVIKPTFTIDELHDFYKELLNLYPDLNTKLKSI